MRICPGQIYLGNCLCKSVQNKFSQGTLSNTTPGAQSVHSEREHPYMVACPLRLHPYLCKYLIFQDFLHVLTEDNSSSIPEEIEKKGNTEKHRVGGTPPHSDRKSHFILKITHQILQAPA